jgi:hypothetical protein
MRGPEIKKWIDLEVGDCLADRPSSDPSVITVTTVDCATAHQAEVYLRAPVGVNAAIADVANRECDAGFSQYTGRSIDGSPFCRDVSHRLHSRSNLGQSHPEYRHLSAPTSERSTPDEVGAALKATFSPLPFAATDSAHHPRLELLMTKHDSPSRNTRTHIAGARQPQSSHLSLHLGG